MSAQTPQTDRFGLPEASYQDAMEMGNSLARAIVSSPDDFKFDQRVLCRAFCFSAREEILATQRWDIAAAERDHYKALCEELKEALEDVRNRSIRIREQKAIVGVEATFIERVAQDALKKAEKP